MLRSLAAANDNEPTLETSMFALEHFLEELGCRTELGNVLGGNTSPEIREKVAVCATEDPVSFGKKIQRLRDRGVRRAIIEDLMGDVCVAGNYTPPQSDVATSQTSAPVLQTNIVPALILPRRTPATSFR